MKTTGDMKPTNLSIVVAILLATTLAASVSAQDRVKTANGMVESSPEKSSVRQWAICGGNRRSPSRIGRVYSRQTNSDRVACNGPSFPIWDFGPMA